MSIDFALCDEPHLRDNLANWTRLKEILLTASGVPGAKDDTRGKLAQHMRQGSDFFNCLIGVTVVFVITDIRSGANGGAPFVDVKCKGKYYRIEFQNKMVSGTKSSPYSDFKFQACSIKRIAQPASPERASRKQVPNPIGPNRSLTGIPYNPNNNPNNVVNDPDQVMIINPLDMDLSDQKPEEPIYMNLKFTT